MITTTDNSPERAIAFLADLAHKLETQDNCYTASPVYEVQEQHLITGIDTSYTNLIGWFHADGGRQAEGEEADALEAAYRETGEAQDDWHRTGYDTRWEQVASFLTRDAAAAYIASNSHRHSGQLRVYVAWAGRNPEIREVRRLLAGPLLQCVLAMRECRDELIRLHSHYYGNCDLECPAGDAIGKVDAALQALATATEPHR